MAADQKSLIRVFDKMTDGILVLDQEWRILYANESGRRYLGLSAQDSTISEDLRPKLQRQFVLSADLMDIEMTEEESMDFEATNPEDRSYDMTLSIYMSRPTEEGTRILLIRDITHEQHERELKHDFLSFISHKLRTPVSTLKIGLSNLRDGVIGDLNVQQVQSLEMSQRKVAAVEKVIEKLITFTTLRDEHIRAEKARIDAQRTARDFCDAFARKLSAKRVNVKYEFGAGDALIDCRDSLFKTMLECILDNSVKFSDKPAVSITVACSRNESSGELTLAIGDDGPGIPPPIQMNVFQPFTQRDDDFTGNMAGLGLGLATVHYVMRLYGGRAELESGSGRGTTIELVFPPKREDSSSENSW